jgi:hypothetical protein
MKHTPRDARPRRHRDISTIEILESRIAPATILVSKLSDDIGTVHSLRWALNQADMLQLAHPGVVNTILLQLPARPAHSENILQLTAALTCQGDVNIVGPGAGKFIINGIGKYQVLNFNDGTSSDRPVTISGLSIVDGAGSNVQAARVTGNTAPNGPDFFGTFKYM